MNRTIAALVTVVALAVVAVGGWRWWTRGTTSNGSPAVVDGWSTLGASSHDFGTVELPTNEPIPLTHRFEIRNDAPTERRIVATTTSCSCVTAEVSPERVAPGGVAEVTVTLALDVTAPRSGTVFIRSEDQAVVQVRVMATGRRPGSLVVNPLPAPLLDDAEIVELTLNLVLHGDLPLPDWPEVTSDPKLLVQFDEWTELPPLSPETLDRRYQGLVKLMPTDAGWPYSLRIRVDGADPVELALREPPSE